MIWLSRSWLSYPVKPRPTWPTLNRPPQSLSVHPLNMLLYPTQSVRVFFSPSSTYLSCYTVYGCPTPPYPIPSNPTHNQTNHPYLCQPITLYMLMYPLMSARVSFFPHCLVNMVTKFLGVLFNHTHPTPTLQTNSQAIFTSAKPSHCTCFCIHSSLSEFSFSLTPSLTWLHSSLVCFWASNSCWWSG